MVRSLNAAWASSVAGETTQSSVWQTRRETQTGTLLTSIQIQIQSTENDTERSVILPDPPQVNSAVSQLPLRDVSITADHLHHDGLTIR